MNKQKKIIEIAYFNNKIKETIHFYENIKEKMY